MNTYKLFCEQIIKDCDLGVNNVLFNNLVIDNIDEVILLSSIGNRGILANHGLIIIDFPIRL